MNFDNKITFILTFIKIFESSINTDKSLFDKNVNFKKKIKYKNLISFSKLH